MRLQLYRGVYCAYWREGHQPVRRSLGTADIDEAKRRLLDLQRGIREAQGHGPRTLADLWKLRREALGTRRMASNMEWSGRAILPVFGHLRPSQITEDLVKQYIADSKKAPGTIWTELSHLRSTLTWAVKREHLKSVPFFSLPSKPPPKEDYLTKEQARAFLKQCRVPHVRLFSLMALATGARSRAILDLTWDRVDFERRLITFGNGEEHRKGRAIVPINNQLYAALVEAREAATGDHVITWAGSPVGSVKKGISRAAQGSGLTFVTPHVFRHSAAVWMAEAGISMEEIAQYLGHSDVSITRKVYARYSPTYLSKAAGALEL